MPYIYPFASASKNPEGLSLDTNLELTPISFQEINPRLLKSAKLGAAQLPGFHPETGLTRARVVREYEIVLFDRSGGYSVVNGNKYQICKGAIRFQKPGDISYSCQYHDVHMLHFALGPDPDVLYTNETLDSIPCFMNSLNPLEFQEMMEKLIIAQLNHDELSIKYILWWILQHLAENAKALNERASLKQNDSVAILKQYLHQHFAEPITLELLGSLVHLNPNYVHRIFKTATGRTPAQYLMDIRLHTSYELLLLTDYKLGHICDECGFNSQSYFITQFKRRYGCTPNTVRLKEQSTAIEHL